MSAAGVTWVNGDVVIDDRLFDSFRVPNGNVLISPILVNENVIDVTLTPGASAGQPGALDWRPRTSAMTMQGTSSTAALGAPADIAVSGDALGDGSLTCIAAPNCAGTLSGAASLTVPASIPLGYRSPLVGNALFVSTLRVEDPASFARNAFIDALVRAGVTVSAPAVAANASGKLPAMNSYGSAPQVASFMSPPYSEVAKLILKVSLNTGANLSLMYVGLKQGARTVGDALAVERKTLTSDIGLRAPASTFRPMAAARRTAARRRARPPCCSA